MYKIIGTDGRPYGPISAEEMRRWIAENRVNAQTQVQMEGSQEWKPLGSFSEFTSGLNAVSAADRAASVHRRITGVQQNSGRHLRDSAWLARHSQNSSSATLAPV